VAVANSDLVVERQGTMCIVGSGDFIIQARNTKTQQIVVIADRDDQWATKIVNDAPDHIVIRVDNRTPLRPVHDAFGPVRVGYDYVPKDDPEDRAAYQRWLYDRQSPENVKWYCTHVMADLDNTNYKIFDHILAEDSSNGGQSYCGRK